MKKSILMIIAAALALLASCKYPVTQSSGKENIAYLIFVSVSNKPNSMVEVTVDGNTVFTAETVKEKKSNNKGTTYAVAPGKRTVRVTDNGNVLYDKVIFLSSQETKKILLP
ncbi:MAG: hypothetical protein J6K01_05680 [Paludibacteraceae bacterium]|nr:hypothetical protein [Paludibacteraceae bacterium]